MKKSKLLITAVFFAMIVCQVYAQDEQLKIGDRVPQFKAVADNGETWKSKNFIGRKNLVVYFYPAAMTGGCTKQACAYRDAQEELLSADAEVVGISGDEVKTWSSSS